MTRQPKLFVYSLCGSSQAEYVNISLRFLKHFTRHEILVVASRCAARIDHDQIVTISMPEDLDDHQASVLMKTNLHRVAGGSALCCYLDTDIIAVDSGIDCVFGLKSGPVTFAADHARMRAFSRWAVRCPCVHGECDHLRSAILSKFGVEVSALNWQHWNGGVFLFDPESTDFMDTWHDYTSLILQDPQWKTRDQGTLIAAAWHYNLQDQPVLPTAYNYIVDAMRGVAESDRPLLQPRDYRVDSTYSFDPLSGLPQPYFLHFINRSLGSRGWKNWDDAESRLNPD